MKIQEAVELAMWLAVTAKETKDSKRCIQIAEELAKQLTAEQVKEAKANVEKKLSRENVNAK
jgi:hypothetical protein